MKIKSLTQIPSIGAYLSRIGAEPRSLRTAIVREQHGTYWTDLATIHFAQDGTVTAPEQYAPTASEAAMIKGEAPTFQWPRHVTLRGKFELPAELRDAEPDSIFKFYNAHGDFVMLQHRVEATEKSDKRYKPYCFFDDDEWRRAEPEGLLPLWGLEHLGDNSTVFVHEGAKAARAMHRLVNPGTAAEKKALAAHPWGLEMANAAHLGWIGGALSPYRTDWSVLAEKGVKRVYIVADNDTPGKEAIPKIAQRLRGMTVFSIEFNDTFPPSFDMADPWPKAFFKKIADKGLVYTGPTFRSLQHPATWATDVIPNPEGKGRPITVLREEFRSMWVWIEESDIYVCREFPEIMRQSAIFDGMVAPFSHSASTSTLLKKRYQGRQTRLAYRPDIKGRMINDGQMSAVNLHTPTQIKSKQGDEAPWHEFLEYLFPVQKERQEVMRWCATLIAKPEIRMLYGMLLVSEQQGMGKSTLGERILAPLVGLHNAGFPSERTVVESNFNDWIANKRLVVIGEIYTGQSWKAYNSLKGYITDKSIEVNKKFERPYTIENWSHILACSNSVKALRIEESDRRWFYPTVSNVPWSEAEFKEFHEWLAGDGLPIIKAWAENFGDYVMTGAIAPMTAGKQELINDSKSEATKMLEAWCDAVAEENIEIAVCETWVRDWLRKHTGTVHESSLQLRNIAKKRGMKPLTFRMKVDGILENIWTSNLLWGRLERIDAPSDEAKSNLLRENVRRNFRRDFFTQDASL